MTAGKPCPVAGCGYAALSQGDLDGHTAYAHRERKPTPSGNPVAAPPAPQRADKPEWHPALYVPQRDPHFWVADETTRLFFVLQMRTEAGHQENVLLRGPKGTGKTTLPRIYAAACKRPFFSMDCGAVSELSDWWGDKELEGGRTFTVRAALVDALETENCVVLLDEANRTHPENLNALFGLLDHRRAAWVPLLRREVRVARGVTFFTTLNEGTEYAGTNPVDSALRDRFSYTIVTTWPPELEEAAILVGRTGVDQDMAAKLVRFANTVRRTPAIHYALSTRALLATCQCLQEGMALQEAALFTVVNAAPEDVDRKLLLQALQMHVGKIDEAWVVSVTGEAVQGATP